MRRQRNNNHVFHHRIDFILALPVWLALHAPVASCASGDQRHPVPSSYTLYASPSGDDKNSGNTATDPKTLSGAASLTKPGSVVCLLSGTYSLNSSFQPPQSGSSSAWIVFKNCGGGPVNLVWTGAADAQPMIRIHGGEFPSGPAYLEFRGLNLDGRGKALDGFYCEGSHHLRFVGNSISNTGGAGIASVTCDYLTADHNVIYHNGYIPPVAGKNAQYYSWTSGISFNSNQWYDRYPGFHNIIANNVIAGEVDQSAQHTDGNGIILDLSNRTYDYNSANTPPALILNNVVYGNGGRCLEAYTVTNFWFVNNTCYKNVLDLPGKTNASVTVNNSRDGYIVNNIVVAASASNPCYSEENKAQEIRYFANLCFGSSNLLHHFQSSSSQFISADPLFARPPDLHPNIAIEQSPSPSFRAQRGIPPPAKNKERSEAPSQFTRKDGRKNDLAAGFALLHRSPALAEGIDPTTLSGLPKELVSGLKQYIYTDLAGNPRPHGGPFDLGAYQSSKLSVPPAH